MAKTKISEFSANPANNTDIDNINIAEGCAPSGINDAIRELMAQLKDFQAGTAGDPFNGATSGAHNGTVGATTPASGAFTSLSYTGAFSGDGISFADSTPSNTLITTASGRVGIGTASPGQLLTVAGNAQIADTFIGNGTIEIGDLGTGDRGCVLDFHSSGTPSSVDFNARIIRNAGVNGSLEISNIGTGNLDFTNGGLVRLFIASDGRINMPNNSGARGFSGYPITTQGDTVANAVRAAGYIEWSTDIGAIGTNYFVSDSRKKENIVPSTYSSLGLVEQIEFVEFDWKPDAGEEGHVQVGVIAQQLQQLDSRLVAELSDGSLMIKEPALVTHLAKAIQEQQAIITALTARIAALEAA